MYVACRLLPRTSQSSRPQPFLYPLLHTLHLSARSQANTTKDLIDKVTLEIRLDDEGIVYHDLEELGEELPDHAPRFVLLSYPLTLVSPSSPSSPLPPSSQPNLTSPHTHANTPPVLRPPLSPLRPPLLPPRHLQRRGAHVIRRCEGITPWRGGCGPCD